MVSEDNSSLDETGDAGAAENEKPPGPFSQIINPGNLALLKQGDRFVIMAAGLIVVAALGAAAAIDNQPRVQAALALGSMLIVFALVALVQWRSFSYKSIEADLVSQSSAAESINGDWWQIVYADDHPGLSHLRISITEVSEKHALQGTSYTSEGVRNARFSSIAIAIRSTTPVEIYYVWRGTRLHSEQSKMIEGFGRFRFDSVGREAKPMEAEGAFTEGSLSELKFENPRTVELIRMSDGDSRLLAKDSSILPVLAKKAFENFQLDKTGLIPAKATRRIQSRLSTRTGLDIDGAR